MKICITGKPCSGKSTAIEYIKKAGYNTFIADEYVHSIYKVNKPGYNAIKKAFGSKYITNKEVNRKALGSLVFKDKKALTKLNKIMNPLIAKAIKNLDDKKLWFIELATYIFYPADFANLFDQVLLVFTNKDWKQEYQSKKFNYLKKIPTFFVDNFKKSKSSIFNIDNKISSAPSINVDIFVDNSANKNILKNNILKICKSLNQHNIK
ncbi:MAG: dephospho-CoA kinase [Mycoplasma sp.]|nr:dephospho-CoA kinase [Candidatus Hennigella equi]